MSLFGKEKPLLSGGCKCDRDAMRACLAVLRDPHRTMAAEGDALVELERLLGAKSERN